MFLALFASASIIQVFQADALGADARNTRARNDEYKVAARARSSSDGKAIAQSRCRSNDVYKFQRVYRNGPLYSAVTGYFPINGEPTGLEGALNDKLAGTAQQPVLRPAQTRS